MEANAAVLLSRWRELSALLQSSGAEQDVKRVVALSMAIAREAPNPGIRALAIKLIATFDALRRVDPSKQDPSSLYELLQQLRGAIEAIDTPSRKAGT